jgi:amino acid adenylation domain-containing protein
MSPGPGIFRCHGYTESRRRLGVLTTQNGPAGAEEEKIMNKRIQPDKLAVAAGQKSKEENYWLDKFSLEFTKTGFPYDSNRSESGPAPPGTTRFRITGKSFSRLMSLINNSDVRLNIFLLSAVTLLLNKYTGDKDIILGTPIYKQEIDVEFINTVLPLRNRVENDKTFKELLLQVGKALMEAVENQNYPMETLLYQLNIPYAPEQDFPLFDAAVLLENIHDKKYLGHLKHNITFSFLRTPEYVIGGLEYNPSRYEESTIERIRDHFINILEIAVANIDIKLPEIDILSPEERKRFLFDYNNTETKVPEEAVIHRLFETQVEKTPDNIAAIHDGHEVTYRELNEKANRLAHVLREKGVKKNTLAGILLEDPFDTAVAMLAILKAGGAYLPINHNLPEKRIAAILEDCRIPVILTKTLDVERHSSQLLQNLQGPRKGVKVTGVRPQISDLDNLVIPDRGLVDNDKYGRYLGQAMVKRCIAIQASRGCPYNCTFCHKIWPKTHVVRSARHVFDEVKLYYDMGVRRFLFIDDIFNLNKENSTAFFRMVIENRLDVQLFFPNGLRSDILTKEYIDLMVEAGAASIAFALETASPRLQKLIRKNLNVEKLRENLEYLYEQYPHVVSEIFSIVGFPTETEEEALMTMDFVKSLRWAHFPYFNILKVFADTEMAKLAIRSGISEETIVRSQNLAFHEIPDTVPFDKGFVKKLQADFINNYFLSKERLLNVLPYQMGLLNEEEIVLKYNSYLPTEINDFDQLLEFLKLSKEELGAREFPPTVSSQVLDLNEKIRRHFPAHQPEEGAYRILLMDLSQFFSHESEMIYDVVEAPIGLMYVMSYLNRRFGGKINGKIAKSRIEFDSYEELKTLIEEFKPDLIGIRTLSHYKNFFHRTVAVIRQWGVDVPIISGGPYATSGYKTLLQNPDIDLVVLGEGEETMGELVEKILENNGTFPGEDQLKEIKGIAYVPGKTRPRTQPARQIIFLDAIHDILAAAPGENPEHGSGGRDLAYVILTSGSTGLPKGVMIEHRGLVNYIRWAAQKYVKNQRVDFPLCTSTAFDLTVTSIFTPLITGNTLVAYSGDEREFIIRKVIEENKVDILKLTPSHLKLIRDILMDGGSNSLLGGKTSKIKQFIVGGENLTSRLAYDISANFNHAVKIYNEYGPTETVVGSMIHLFDPAGDKEESVPIGVPIHNTQIYLLDENKKPVPFGVAGELFISGNGVARGYLNRPELTAKKFVDNPFLPGQRMYATGDLARRLPDENIEFLGRKDQQVKIRGFRVELEEIENKIRNFNKTVQANLPQDRENLQPPVTRETIRCGKCLLPRNYPAITFDEDGTCSVCREFESHKQHLDVYFKTPDDFNLLLERSGAYDCLLMFSGGKDSSYVLYRLVDMGLKVLAFTFDNGYISEAAFKNIERITSLLNVDHIVDTAENMNHVFVESLKSNHNVCHGCWHTLNTKAVKIAHERGINLVVSGLSRGQIYDMRLDGLFQAGIFDENEIEEKLLSFRKVFHSKENKFSRLLNLELDETAVERIQFVDFFRYFSTPVHKIKQYLSEKAWVQPKDTGFCSSNCIINDVGIYMYLKELGYHFYAAPLSWDIRLGQLSREEGMKEMGFEGDLQNVGHILEEIGYYNVFSVKDAVVADKEDGNGNKLLSAYIVPENDVSLSESELREYLYRELPDYMIPSYFIQVDEIPLAASGKADKKALLETQGARLQISAAYVEPQDEKEKIMARLCMDVFKLDKIGINDNFFSRGATSFSIIQLNNKLQGVFEKDIPVLTMFEYPTIASFLEYMDLDTPGPRDSQDAKEDAKEEEDWARSRKKGQNKFKNLRNKRTSQQEF